MKVLERLNKVEAFALPPTKDSGFVTTLSKMYKDKANVIAGNVYDNLADLIMRKTGAGIIEVGTFLNSSYGKKLADLFLRNVLEGNLGDEALRGYVSAPKLNEMFQNFLKDFKGK